MSASTPGEMQAYVLDSYAILAYLEGETGAERVQALLSDASRGGSQLFLSMLNLGEILYIIEREQGLPKAQAALATIEQLPIEILPVSPDMVFKAAHIKAHYPMAYADAFVVAAAQTHNGAIVTGDPEFRAVEALVKIDWLKSPI